MTRNFSPEITKICEEYGCSRDIARFYLYAYISKGLPVVLRTRTYSKSIRPPKEVVEVIPISNNHILYNLVKGKWKIATAKELRAYLKK